MSPTTPCVLTINGGSSSIKFALFKADTGLDRILAGRIEGIGLEQASFTVTSAAPADTFARELAAPDQGAAVGALMDWIRDRMSSAALAAVVHRVVHGGPRYWEPQRLTAPLLAELHELSPFDPEHLPAEILLIEAFQRRFPALAQIVCFDTAFHHAMPRVARWLPIPRRYDARGVRRYGFHGLSCEYLMGELARVAGPQGARGRVILAHLGNGASITAVLDGRSIDTSMGFTPTAGLPMSTRSGDLDPGLGWYLAHTEGLTARQFHHMVNHESGLLGVSDLSPDMQLLLRRATDNPRAAEAVDLFCYQVKKWVGALAAALGGLDTLIFAGGIGENAAEIRARACHGLEFLGIRLDEPSNQVHRPVISAADSPVTVRVMRTDEGWILARTACRVLGLSPEKGTPHETRND